MCSRLRMARRRCAIRSCLRPLRPSSRRCSLSWRRRRSVPTSNAPRNKRRAQRVRDPEKWIPVFGKDHAQRKKGNTSMGMRGGRPTISSVRGVVAAAHPLAAQAGATLLQQGGNAFDAAGATAAALNVVEPYMSGLAGQGLATCWVAAERRIRVLDFVPPVPSRFPVERFTRCEELARGPLSVGLPGNLAGWTELVRAYGRKPLTEALRPATDL